MSGTDLVLTPTPRDSEEQTRQSPMRIRGRIGQMLLDLGAHPSANPTLGGEYGWLWYASKSSSPETTVQAALATLITEMCGSVDVAMEISGAQLGALRPTLEVSSLIGAMWLQFALAVDGNRKYRSCPECGEWWDATDTRLDRQTWNSQCEGRTVQAPGIRLSASSTYGVRPDSRSSARTALLHGLLHLPQNEIDGRSRFPEEQPSNCDLDGGR